MDLGQAGVRPYGQVIAITAAATADPPARIVTTMTMVAVPIADTVQLRRLIEFASDAAHLADERLDLDLRQLVDDLHRDLIELEEER